MDRTKLTITVGVVGATFALLGACGSSDGSDVPTARSVQSTAVPTPSTPAEPEVKPVIVDAFRAHHFETLEDMATVNVIFGRVVADRKGVEATRGEFDDADREIRRVITVKVLDQLSGDLPVDELEIRTLGWTYVDGQLLPLTVNGEPWLKVGDEALMAVDDPLKPGRYGFMSDAGVQLFRDNKIVLGPGTASLLNKSLVGMTKEDVKESFSKIATTP